MATEPTTPTTTSGRAYAGPAPAAESFAQAILEILEGATWPDGSQLIEVADEVLQDRLAPRIHAAAQALVATSAATARHTMEVPA